MTHAGKPQDACPCSYALDYTFSPHHVLLFVSYDGQKIQIQPASQPPPLSTMKLYLATLLLVPAMARLRTTPHDHCANLIYNSHRCQCFPIVKNVTTTCGCKKPPITKTQRACLVKAINEHCNLPATTARKAPYRQLVIESIKDRKCDT